MKVNQALESLPIGKISDVIEGPDGFHIVTVEWRRPAGPASFEEVQDQIRPKLMEAFRSPELPPLPHNLALPDSTELPPLPHSDQGTR